MNKKQNEEKNEGIELTVSIPFNTMKPVNGRIFAIAVNPAEVKTASGIIVPTSIDKGETSQGERRILKLHRYFVIDYANDINENLKNQLSRGVEIFPFVTEEAIGWTFPYIIDWSNAGARYTVIHESEVAGISGHKPVDIDKLESEN
jgi:hypothetical protein